DGIRVFHVTGVQTCALPIWLDRASWMVAPVLERLRASIDEPGRADPRRGAGERCARRVRGTGPVVCPGAFPGLGGPEGPDQQRRRTLVPHTEDRTCHRRGPSPAAPLSPRPLAARAPLDQRAMDA